MFCARADCGAGVNAATLDSRSVLCFSRWAEAPCGFSPVLGILWQVMQALLSESGSPAMRP
jgi:hypothetical protein